MHAFVPTGLIPLDLACACVGIRVPRDVARGPLCLSAWVYRHIVLHGPCLRLMAAVLCSGAAGGQRPGTPSPGSDATVSSPSWGVGYRKVQLPVEFCFWGHLRDLLLSKRADYRDFLGDPSPDIVHSLNHSRSVRARFLSTWLLCAASCAARAFILSYSGVFAHSRYSTSD